MARRRTGEGSPSGAWGAEGEEVLGEICSELRRVVERLDDIAFDALRSAVSAGGTRRPERERRVTRARHALERAISILEHAGSEAGTEEAGTEEAGTEEAGTDP